MNTRANEEVTKSRQQYETQVVTLKAKLGRTEMKLGNLEGEVERKTKENADLMKMCDELIAQLDDAGTRAS